MLSCECYDWDGEGWGYYCPEDFTTLNTKRRRRCLSCKELIEIGSPCLEFERHRYPQNEIEERIHGDWDVEIPIAPYWMCEKCGEKYLNLHNIGYCIEIPQDMRELMKEYWELTGFEPKK